MTTNILDQYPQIREAYEREPVVHARVRTGERDGAAHDEVLAACVVDLAAELARVRDALRRQIEGSVLPVVVTSRPGEATGWPRRKCVECDGQGIVWATERGQTAVRCVRCNGRGER